MYWLVDELTVDELTVDEISVDDLTCYQMEMQGWKESFDQDLDCDRISINSLACEDLSSECPVSKKISELKFPQVLNSELECQARKDQSLIPIFLQ